MGAIPAETGQDSTRIARKRAIAPAANGRRPAGFATNQQLPRFCRVLLMRSFARSVGLGREFRRALRVGIQDCLEQV